MGTKWGLDKQIIPSLGYLIEHFDTGTGYLMLLDRFTGRHYIQIILPLSSDIQHKIVAHGWEIKHQIFKIVQFPKVSPPLPLSGKTVIGALALLNTWE